MILLDTHAALWSVLNPERLSAAAMHAIEIARQQDGIAIAAVTLFEAAHFIAQRRIDIHVSIGAFVDEFASRFVLKDINVAIAVTSAQLTDPYPRDPMDRLIGATAIVEGMPLVTADERIRQSGRVRTIW